MLYNGSERNHMTKCAIEFCDSCCLHTYRGVTVVSEDEGLQRLARNFRKAKIWHWTILAYSEADGSSFPACSRQETAAE